MAEMGKSKLETIGKRVSDARRKKGLSQTELATAIMCSQNNISKIERGISGANLENLARIAKALDVTEDYLLLRSEFPTYADEVRDAVGKMQRADALWTEFIRHIALYAGFEMREEASSYNPSDTDSPYMRFLHDGGEDYLSLSDVNDLIAEVTKHAGLSLQISLEKRRRKNG